LTLVWGILPLFIGVIEEKTVIIPENRVKGCWFGEVLLLNENMK